MQAAAGRDRIYVLTLVLTLVAICAFGVFVIRDYQDQGSQKVGLARLGGAATGGDASLPSTGDTGSAAAQGSTGASSGSAAGTSAGAAAGTSGTAAGSSAGTSGGTRGGSVAHSGSTGSGAGSAPVPAPVAGPGGTSPACVNGHIRIG